MELEAFFAQAGEQIGLLGNGIDFVRIVVAAVAVTAAEVAAAAFEEEPEAVAFAIRLFILFRSPLKICLFFFNYLL